MNKVLHCDCGFEVRAGDEDEFVAAIQRHAAEVHGMTLSQDEALLLAFRGELDEQAPLTTPRDATTRTNKEEQ